MKRLMSNTLVVLGLLAAAGAGVLRAQQPLADFVLTNGKIITVDNQFRIAQAVAIRGDRFLAVGTNQEINRLAGPATRRVDLGGKAVIPGLIDHHAHLMRAAETWNIEVRLDGVDSRKQALEMVRAKATALGPGQWVYTLGGWSYDQFADNRAPLTKAELDQAAPNNPVYLQFQRCCAFLNSKAIEAMGVDAMMEPWVERDAAGRATGRVNDPGLAQMARKVPPPPKDTLPTNALALVRDLNRAGLTTAGIVGCTPDVREFYEKLHRSGELTFRFMCMVGINAGNTLDAVRKAAPEIAKIKLYRGDDYVDDVQIGETIGLSDNMLQTHTSFPPDQLAVWRATAMEVARNRLPLHQHATISESISALLDQIEAVDREFPLRNLRWSLAHLDQVSASNLGRMKKLGMYAGMRAIEPVMGAIFTRTHGERTRDMPPYRMIQDSGILWGLHTDTTEVNQYLPFTTLSFVVTGKMIGGTVVNRQPVTREEALIAHTRNNAFLVFRESDLGSIAPGKLADLVVMDRDYLTIPADQIKDIKPAITVVGGKIVYEAAAPTRSIR